MTNIKNTIEKNKMKILWSALGVLSVILVIALIITNRGNDESDKKDVYGEKKVEEQTTVAELETEPEETFLAEPTDSEYNALFKKYYESTYVEWDEAGVTECIENMENISSTGYTLMNKYIEAVQDIYCYIGYETEDGKQLIYVTYNLKFQNIETTVPCMEASLVVEVDGKLKIHNFEVGEELDFYTNVKNNDPNYKELQSTMNNQLDIALGNDADLKKVYDVLLGISE